MGKPRLTLRRLLHPTLQDCLVFWLLVGLCFGVPLVQRISDPDLWWHLRTGQIIAATHKIPHVDPFSFTMHGQPWVAHEWLSELALWFAYTKAGFAGICLLKAVLVLAVFSVVYATARRRTASFYPALIATAISAIVACPSWSERPQLFGYLFLAILLWLIQRHKQGGSLWPVIPLFVLWINFHGSWLIGMAVLLWSGVGTGYEAVKQSKPGVVAGYAIVAVLAIAALFINPRPLVYAAYPFQYLGATHHTSYISEWQVPDFHDPAFAGFAAVLIGMGLLLRASRAKLDPFECMLVLGLAGASLYSLRHIPVFAIVSASFIAEHLAAVQLPQKAAIGQKQMGESPILHWLVLLALPFLIYVRLPNTGPTPYLNLKTYPVRAFDYISGFHHSGRLLTNYDWGGYAIFRMWSDYHVFIDGRADLYGPEMIKRIRKLDDLSPGWQKELERADPDIIVWPRQRALSQALAISAEWREIKLSPRDKVAAIFVRRGKQDL